MNIKRKLKKLWKKDRKLKAKIENLQALRTLIQFKELEILRRADTGRPGTHIIRFE